MSDELPNTYRATDSEIKARNKRNVAIAVLLLIFVALLFVTIIARMDAAMS